MLDLNQKYILSNDIVVRGINNKYWALNVKDGTQFKLNSTSFLILDSLHEAKTLNEIINLVLDEYNVSREKLIDDCNAIIPIAINKKIIKEEVR